MSFVVPVCKVTTPPATVDGVVVPVIVSIFVSKSVIGPLTLTWLRARFVAPATKVMIVPLTVTVSRGAKFAPIEFVAGAPESSVKGLIGAGGAALLFCAEPGVLESAKGVGGVPAVTGFLPAEKSAGRNNSDPGTDLSCLLVNG